MSGGEQWKAVETHLAAPFEDVVVRVNPVSIMGRGVVAHSVYVGANGQGVRSSVKLAEAEARAVLRAIRGYRRANAKIFEEEGRNDG